MTREKTAPQAHQTQRANDTPGTPLVPQDIFSVEPTADIVDVRETFALQPGKTISAPGGDLTIIERIGSGGEGVTYLASATDGTKRTVKVERERGGSNLEEKLRVELLRANKALGTDMRLVALNPIDFAVIRDYIEGESLERYLTGSNRTFTQRETAIMLRQTLENYLKPLHEEKLVHRDVKPNNIIVTEKGNAERAYTLIDFGLLREDGDGATVTLNIKGTPGYSRFSAQHAIQDDYYGLAETALFVLSGKHPSFIGTPELDKKEDEARIAKMPIDEEFKKFLLKMLGHRGQYETPEAALADLAKVERRFNGKSDVSIDLDSASAIAQYRAHSEPPQELLAEIAGLREMFGEIYNPVADARHRPIDDETKNRLVNTLGRLGYRHQTAKGGERWVRQRLHEDSIDVFTIKKDTKDYFDYTLAKDAADLEQILRPQDGSEQGIPAEEKYEEWKIAGRVMLPALLAGAGYLIGNAVGGSEAMVDGTLSGLTASATVLGLQGIVFLITEGDTEDIRFDHDSPYNRCLVPLFGIPHLVGKIAADVQRRYHAITRRVKRAYHQAMEPTDTQSLDSALRPMPLFTYGLYQAKIDENHENQYQASNTPQATPGSFRGTLVL